MNNPVQPHERFLAALLAMHSFKWTYFQERAMLFLLLVEIRTSQEHIALSSLYPRKPKMNNYISRVKTKQVCGDFRRTY